MSINLAYHTTKTLEEIENQIKIIKLQEEILQLREKIQAQIDSQYDTLSKFYAIVLDSHPKLHPHIEGNSGTYKAIELSTDIQDFLQQGNTNPEEVNQLAQCAQQLQQASAYYLKFSPLYKGTEKEIESTIQQIHDQIANLAKGKSCILIGEVKNHAILYQIKKVEEKYVFTIINTGNDEQLMDLSEENFYMNNKRKVWFQLDTSARTFDEHKIFKYADKAYTCDLHALNPDFLASILPLKTDFLLITELLEHIDKAMTDNGGIQVSGRTHHKQGKSSCGIKSLNSWLKGMLVDQFGEYRGRVLHAQFKVFRTEKQVKELKQLEKEASPEHLQQFYQVNTPAKLQQKQQERDAAVQQVYQKRLRKASGCIF